MREYRVEWYEDERYRVLKIKNDDMLEEYHEQEETVYSGSLADCEAWIRLTEQGYM